MSQADHTFITSDELKPMSRRAALRTTAAFGAVGLGLGLAHGKAGSLVSPDAELLKYEKRIDALFAETKDAWARWDEAGDQTEDAMESLRVAADGTELWPSCEPKWWSRDEFQRYWEARGPIEKANTELHAADDETEVLSSEEAAMAKTLFRTRAATLTGLALKARVAAYENNELWEVSFEDLDWPQQFVRDLIDSILELAGKPFEPLPSA